MLSSLSSLPVPKCSTCGQFVPLEQLGDHVCQPKPLSTNILQRRTPSPATSTSPAPTNARLSVNTSSSRARPPSKPDDTLEPPPTARPILHSQSLASHVPQPSVHSRSGTPLAYRAPPRTSSTSRSATPASVLLPPTATTAPQRVVHFSATITPGDSFSEPNQQSFVPPPERGIDTKSGGEAGMAGIGRRGFAAVARAAMFAHPTPHSQRKSNQPKYLDLDAVPHSTEPPPLSAGSGYSSHSPGPTSPLPQSEFPSPLVPTKITRTPSPPNPDHSILTPTQPDFLKPATSEFRSLVSPLAARLPFFEKFKNKMPATSDSPINDPSASTSSIIPSSISIVRKNTSDSFDSISLYRSTTSSTTSSRQPKDVRRPISPLESESEYGGLAYADSTDSEADGLSRSLGSVSRPPAFILRAGSNSSARRHRASGSEPSRNGSGRIVGLPTRPNHAHTNSTASSVYSAGGTRDRSNSSAIAQALGLSQTPPSDYGKIGGPGVMRGQNGSISRRNARPDSIEEMEKALEEAKTKTINKQPSSGSSSPHSFLHRLNTSTSTLSSTRSSDDDVIASGSALKAHRSNTIQSPRAASPDKVVKTVKLPMRALTSPKFDRDKALDGTGMKKERVQKVKVCMKCQKMVDNGRWVSVDGGGVLCERCWKNMYLPKCRRCNLSIEKQAVSSSDGQLKGKYHKECFNCDICHKSFPDRTFYVYDGKPLCAYHYHEANDSLCAAARCGQPIEGPCAVSHSGDRYHPEHMTCEHSGYPSCSEMLSEYWEIDGRMLCERHANSASAWGSDEEDEEWAKSKRRVTRFIDLPGGVEGVGGGDGELL